MKLIPFSVIKAAKENDPEAAEKIRKHYDSYIGSRCLQSYTDENGTRHNAFCMLHFTFLYSGYLHRTENMHKVWENRRKRAWTLLD